MTMRSAVWTGVTLAAIGIGGLAFTGVAGATGLHLPWTQARAAESMMSNGTAAMPGVMGRESGGYGGMMGGSAPGIIGGAGAGAMGAGMMDALPGQMMGTAMSGVTGQSVSPAEAQRLGAAVPAGATADLAANRLVFATGDVRFTVLASPADGPDMTFRIAGMADPTVVVPKGATVTVQFVNADADTAHGWLLTPARASFPYMAMMADPPAFAGAVAMPLGDPSAAGMPTETISFTASQPGQYTYLCPVPGHAQQGMHGGLQVAA